MSLEKQLLGIANSAIKSQQKERDKRGNFSQEVDVLVGTSYAQRDKKAAEKAINNWQKNTWENKLRTNLTKELQIVAPQLKPGSAKYKETYSSLYKTNLKKLEAAKIAALQKTGVAQKSGQSRLARDNKYRQVEADRTGKTAYKKQHAAKPADTALAIGASRLLRAPLQLAADVGRNDDGSIFDKGAKFLEGYEQDKRDDSPEYTNIQENGSFGKKLVLSAVEQIPSLAVSLGAATAVTKGVQLLGAGAKMTAGSAYGTAAATMYPQAYLDGNDSTKQELENATPEQLATAVRSKDTYKGHFDKNIKAGMSENEAYVKARDQTISSIAEESGDAVGLATLALSMLAPGVGSVAANRAAGGAVSQWGQKVFNKLAVRADAGKVAKVAIPAVIGTAIVGLNIAEEALQEGFTDHTAQSAAVDVGVKDKVDTAQLKETMLMGGILGGMMGGSVYLGTRNSKLHQAQDDLRTAQQAYAEVAGQIPQLQQQIEAVSPRSPEGQALTARVEETRAALDAMAAEAEKASIPRTSLARRAPRIEPSNSFDTEFDGQVDGATELDTQGFENTLNPDGTPAPQAAPVAPVMSEQELDAQDVQIAELIAEQEALDEAIDDGSHETPLEESIAAAQSWYDSKRGAGEQGLAGVVSRAAATEEDTAFAQQQEGAKGTTASVNDYIASERAKQQKIEAQLQQESQAATTEAEKQAVAEKIAQREAERAKEDEVLATREQLAQPYDGEAFDTTIVGADGAPFKLARFWDSNMPASAKAKAIAEAFGGQVEQNVAKSNWANLPEGVQKELHKWFTDRLAGVRQSREGAATQTDEQVTAPTAEQPQEVAPTANGLTMPAPQVVEQAEVVPAATQLTDENPVINIPAPGKAAPKEIKAAPTTDTGVYKSQSAARAAMKRQKLDPKSVSIAQVTDGYTIVQAGTQQTDKVGGLTEPVQEQQSVPADSELSATGDIDLTEQNPVINISAPSVNTPKSLPSVSDATSESVNTPATTYKSEPAARAAIKKRKLNAKTATTVKTDKGWEIIEASDNPKTSEADVQTSEVPQVSSENGGPVVQDLTATTLEVASNDINNTEQSNDSVNTIDEESETITASPVKPPQSSVVKAETTPETKKPTAKKAVKPTTPIETVAEIEDFGEKITGARKDVDSFYQREITDDDISSQPLSKIWPKKDIEAIEDKQTAALATVLRGTIPSKPRKGYKLNNWVEQIKNARGIMQQIMGDDTLVGQFIEQMTKVKGLQTTGYHAQLLSAINQDQWERVTAVDHRPYYAIQNDDGSTSPDMSFDITIDKRRHVISTENKQISEVVDKVNELLSGEVKAPTLKFDLYSRGRGDAKSWFITQTSDKDKTPLITFSDRDTARSFLKESNNDLSELWAQHKEKVNVKKTDTRSRQNRERIGTDHRGGQDITTEQFMEAFGLRGGQFGNWVKQGANSKDRQGMLNEAYDAFMDLASVLNIPPEAIGLGGKLGMSFGARGKGSAMAHYEPSQVVINLTKTKGAGTLAHEWFHALDHHFTSFRDSPARNKSREDAYITYKPEPSMMYTPQKGRGYLISKPALEKRRANSKDPMYAAENWAPDPSHPEGVRPQVEEAFADLVNALNDSPMKERANTIDKGATDGYWSRIIERAARAFESYIIHKLDKQGARSDFLANVTPENAFPRNMDRYPYLLESEMAPVAEAFDNLFATIDSKSSEDGNGKTLFSRAGQMKQAAESIKTNPAQGKTGTTATQIIDALQKRFGKEVVAKLVKAGKLRVRTLDDFVNADGRLLIPSDAEGFYYEGNVVLIADNITSDNAVATLLHEMGGHAGIQSMLDPQTYMNLMTNFDNLVKSGNKYAVAAKERAEATTSSESEARDEYIPYLITEYAQATEKTGPIGAIKRFVNRVLAGVRAWVRKHTGVDLKMTPNDITQLAERMVKRLAEQSARTDSMVIAGVENMPAGQMQFSQDSVEQADTPAFKEWFGDSKVVDSSGNPLIVYHGTIKAFNEFNTTDFGALLGKGSYFTANKAEARQYSGQGTRIVPAYLSIENPYYVKSAMDSVPSREEMLSSGYDGVIQKNDDGSVNWAVAHKPTQIKSATDNAGTFDSSNPDIRFSRRYSSLGTDGKPVTAKEKARDRVALAQAVTMSSKFGINLLLRRHLATPQHVALLNPVFKIFTDNVQARIAYENNEAGLVQTYLPEIWDTRLIVGKKKEAMERVSKAIFDGTMADKVWTDSELETMFNLTPQDIGFYRRSRQAIDGSVLNMTVDTLSSLAKGTKLVNLAAAGRLKLAGLTPVDHNVVLQQHMTDELEKLAKGGLISAKAEARMQKQLDDVFDVMSAVAGKSEKLAEQGYAPLMRFGNYAVEVRDKTTNDLDLFELYETKGQQRKAIKELKERYDETQFTVGTGTLNPEGFKQFKDKGLSPETVQLFAAELGLDEDGAHQAYLKIAVSDRSALKRLIHRKKVPGYSEDMPRVLSAFVMSNARYSGRSLYNGEIERSIQNIEDGNLQNEAQKVFENMENPQEEFAGTRSLMFHYFMGFSPAFFFLNLTQPFTQTIPKLTAYAGVTKGHAYMAQALGMVGKHMGAATINAGKKAAGMPTPNWKGFEDKLPAWVKKEDYLRMAREGHLDPQNIYMIKGLERGKQGVASGVWGNIESAAGWFAEVSESINRRSTMLAAFRVAKDMGDAQLKAKGFDSKYDFAVSIIQQTQGIYNKANRSGLARGNGKLGQYGPLILVFKQFTINYSEQMIRHGRDKEVKSLAVAMMWQFALAGMLGLPFADDLRDIFEGIAYRVFGKAFNLPDYLEGILGKSNADALMYGLASEKGRIDIYGRSSLGNIIPGTDVVRPGPTDWAEVLGASSGFYESFFSAAALAADGHYKDALITASPRYIRDAASGVEIAMTGSYRNTKGDKIMDLDKTDAVIKSLAFNPANNAKPGRDRSNTYNMKNMLKAKTDYFSKHLAEAMYQENDDRLDELYVEMDAWNDKNAEHFNVDIDKIEKSAEKRVERKDFGSAERQNIQDSLALRQEDLAGT